jgi:hypothetical protein
VDAHLATYDASGTVSGIDDRSIIAILVGAVQDLWTRVLGLIQSDEAQNARIQQLEEEVAALKAQSAAAGAPSSGVASGAPDSGSASGGIHDAGPPTVSDNHEYTATSSPEILAPQTRQTTTNPLTRVRARPSPNRRPRCKSNRIPHPMQLTTIPLRTLRHPQR